MSPAKSDVTQAAWSVGVADGTHEQSEPKPYEDLRLVWGKSNKDGKPKYIFELGIHEKGLSCDCICYSCGNPLAAVNAGKVGSNISFIRKPHFRHHKGSQKSDCIYHAARVAALKFLLNQGALQLPRRRISGRATGVSGKEYVAWIEVPPEQVKISSYVESYENDTVKALLTLDDGREIAIILVANIDVKMDEEGELLTSTVKLMVSDPSIAAMSLEELKGKISIIVDDAKWCKHWDDQAREAEAVELALKQAENALDWLDIIDGLPSDCDKFLKQETILHIQAKEILQDRKKITLPELFMKFSETATSGKVITAERYIKPEEIKLCNVALEVNIGNIRPDVVADIDGISILVSDKLLIEITVTNHIVGERLEKIKKHNIPTIEIDISLMGGEISYDDFAEFIINSTQGKSWIHHPMIAEIENQLKSELKNSIEIENDNFERNKDNKKISFQVKPETNEAGEEEYLNSLRNIDQADVNQLGRLYCASIKRFLNHSALFEPIDKWRSENKNLFLTLQNIAYKMKEYGFPTAADREMFLDKGSIMSVLLSFKYGTPIGYNIDSIWQVINSLICQKSEMATQWHTLFLIAIRIYPPVLNENQQKKLSEWREGVSASIKSGEMKYARNDRHDKLLSLLFPEMAKALISNFGKRNALIEHRNQEKPERMENIDHEKNSIDHFKKDSRFHFSVLKRLECISRNKTIGRYIGNNSAPIWETISAIIHERPSETEWLIVYITAIDEYKPSMNWSRTNLYQNWRSEILANTEIQKAHAKSIESYGEVITKKFPRLKFK